MNRQLKPSQRKPSRRTLAVVIAGALVVTTLLSACSGIPRSGAVHGGQAIATDTDAEFDYKPEGPQADASQEDILRGFVEAASSPADNYAVARQFLAPNLVSTWNPDAGVTVDQQALREFSAVGESAQSLTVVPVAEVDATGLYSEIPAGVGANTQSYGFTQINDQWRISSAPDGVILDPIKFSDVFSAYSLSFFDPTWTYLVPDQRWFPSRASTGTRIVRALLEGPSSWLAPGVVTAFPEGTTLRRGAVPVDNGQATVDFGTEALSGGPVTLERMQAQLVSSLLGVSSIRAVSVAVDGNSQQINTLAVSAPRLDPRALVSTEEGFGFLSAGGLEKIPGISAQIDELEASAVVLGADRTLAAAKSTAGVFAVRSEGQPVLLDTRADLIDPALDQRGFIWSVPRSSPSSVLAFTPEGQPSVVETSWPDASSIVSLTMSRDGTRVAALLRVGSVNRFVVTAVERGENGVPRRLGNPLDLAVAEGEALSATWVDAVTVASLTTTTDGNRIIEQQIGGQSEDLASLAGAVSLVGGNTAQQLRALTAEGVLYIRRPTAWQRSASGVSNLATQLGTPG